MCKKVEVTPRAQLRIHISAGYDWALPAKNMREMSMRSQMDVIVQHAARKIEDEVKSIISKLVDKE